MLLIFSLISDKTQTVGLSKEYNKGLLPIVRLVQRLAALPLLKIGHIEAGFNYAASTTDNIADELIKAKMNQLLDYVKKTWTGVHAKFDCSIWSRFDVEGKIKM